MASSGSLNTLRLLSLADYFASLAPQGAISWERALVSVADRFGLTAALPLALFLPNRWRREAAAGGLLRSFPSLAASSLVTTAVSTLDLTAFSQTVHLYAAGQQQQQKGQAQGKGGGSSSSGSKAAGDAAERAAAAQLTELAGPLDILRTGCSPRSSGAAIAASLTSPLLLSAESVQRVLGLTAEEAADASLAPAPSPKPLSPLLPDLHLGNGGLSLSHSRAGAAICGLMAAVANRLTANALAGMAPAAGLLPIGGQQSFAVQLFEGRPQLTTLEGLLEALREAGHDVQLTLSSNLTSFGVGLSVRDSNGGSDSWQQVPLAYPLRCSGLWTVSNCWLAAIC